MKPFKYIGVVLVALSLIAVPLPAQAQSENVTERAFRITTNTTTPVVSQTVHVYSIEVDIEVAGASANTLTIQNKEGTPKKLAAIDTTTVGNKRTTSFTKPILFTGGIDIVTATGTASTANVWITYR